MERQQQVSEILRRNCREAIFALIIIVEDSCHTQQRIHERLFQMQAGVVYGHPYNQQAFTGVQVRLCLEKDWLSPGVQVGGGVQGQQQGGFGGAPSQQQPGGWAQPPPYGLQ